MKKINISYWCYCLLAATLCLACNKTDYPTFETKFTGIYFQEDSIRYSFGITPLATTSYILKLPVRIMGVPASQKRTFKFEIITHKTTAKANEHYRMPQECVIEADSVNGILPLEILRENLSDSVNWQITFKLVQTEDFSPVSEAGHQIIASFNNIVEPPAWKDWQGKPTWPDDKLGPWNPIVWVKFMEYFRQMEQTNPASYQAIVKACGENLENVEYGWPWDFDLTLKKYVLIPLYDFFQNHPEYIVEMPDPNA